MWRRLKRLLKSLMRRGASEPPPEVGPPGLAPCPSTPNCVSSRADDRAHFVEPLSWEAAREDAVDAAARVLREMGGEIRTLREDYLHATFTIRGLGFVDDVELVRDAQAGVLHVRSASRVGHSDLGVNRRRVERIRRALQREAARFY